VDQAASFELSQIGVHRTRRHPRVFGNASDRGVALPLLVGVVAQDDEHELFVLPDIALGNGRDHGL
jgi:hypothetical protein